MATTRKHVQQSMADDNSTENSSLQRDFEMAQLARADAPTIPDEKWYIYKLVKSKRGGYHIDGIDDVINPQGKLERIYLISGANSIWSSELGDLLKDKDYVSRNRRSLDFSDSIMRVPSWDTNALEFIKHSRHLIDNPSRRSGSKHEFFEYNPAKQQEAALKKEMLELDMAMAVRDMKIEKVKKLASFFGISFVDDLGQAKGDDGIRRELMLTAKRNPTDFEKHIDSKEVEVEYLVKKAVLDAKINLGGVGENVTWAAGGGYIAKMPGGVKAIKYLTELAMTNSNEGRQFLEQLQKLG